MDSDMTMELYDCSPEYADLKKQLRQLSEAYPAIHRLLDDDGELHLTSKEHEAFLEYFRLCLAADVLEREHLYFRGHADGFAYLKKIGAFKTE